MAWTAPAAAAAPANDNFANAVTLTGSAGTVSGTTVGATSQAGEQCAIEVWGCGASVWYSWQAPAATTTQVSFETCHPDVYDTTLQGYTGSNLATLDFVVEDDGACGSGSRITFAAVPGTTYSIRVGGYGNSMGNFQLRYCEGSECPDTDSDGVPTPADDCPAGDTGWTSNATTDHDSDGCRDSTEDTDDDGDGKSDGSDSCAAGELGWTSNGTTDADSDGCRDAGEDTDDDNDTVADSSDSCPTVAGSTANGCAPVVAPPPTVTPPAGSTGQRAAALRKCKQKKRRARQSCIKKAKKLPI